MSSHHNGGEETGSTRRRVLAAMGGASVIGLAGCVSDDDGNGNGGNGNGNGGNGNGGNGNGDSGDAEFIASSAANPGTFDPTIITDATSNSVIGTMAYESLVAPLFDLSEFRGELATDWEEVDETTIRFQIREGVQFHNGDELVAEDVEFSINRTSGTANNADVSWIAETEVLDDYEIELRTEEPVAPYLSRLSAVPILPRNAEGISEDPESDDHAFDEESIGTGPFELESFETEDRVVLVPFEDYWYDGDEYPSTAPWERVTFRIITEQVSQEEAMANGELDMIDNAAPFELDQWENQTGEVISGDAVGFDFVTYPLKQEPYTNQKLRQGMTKMIPRTDVIEAIFGGNATALGGPISPGLGAFWDEDHEQQLLDEFVGEDFEAGLELVEEAFEEEGIEPPFELAFITNVNRTRERWMEVIQQTFDETDLFDAELDVRAFDDLVPFLLDPEGAAESTDIVGIGWTGGSDPDGHVNDLLNSERHVPDGFNWNLYENEEVDELIADGLRTVDIDDRVDVYHELQEVLAVDIPFVSMWTGDQIDVLAPDALESLDQWAPHPNSSNRYNALYKPHLDQVAFPPQ